MRSEAGDPGSAWADAVRAAALFAIDPLGAHGVVLRARPGPVRDQWLAILRNCLPQGMPVRRVPINITDGRLLGGLDLTATLNAGKPVVERGVLADADGGVLLLAMAERIEASTAAHLAAVLDTKEVVLERDGVTRRTPARCGMVAFDEGLTEDEQVPLALLDRLAFHLCLHDVGVDASAAPVESSDRIAASSARLADVRTSEEILAAICEAAMYFGVSSVRAPLLALRAARANAALEGRADVLADDAAVAGRLILAPRATRLPAFENETEDDTPQPEAEDLPDRTDGEDDGGDSEESIADLVVAATQAAIPADLLARLHLSGDNHARPLSSGRSGVRRRSTQRGRPIGTCKSQLRSGVRLNVVETLKAAAPWQRLRRRHDGCGERDRPSAPRIEVRRDDFRITRFKQRTETATIFVVDASGSSALHRLAEAKGAIELLLADCYARRDHVALIAFRGHDAELLLPPTRSLARAKRSLASLPGGGGTPLATGIDAAFSLAETVRRKDQTPIIVLLTDGRANVSRNAQGGRTQAMEDALDAARAVRAAKFASLVIDTSPRPHEAAERLADEMKGRYLPLPQADAVALSECIRAASTQPLAASA